MSYNVERRQSPRKRFDSLLYVELEPGNGGLVLNFSEHGFGFRAAKRIRPKQEVQFAFDLNDKHRLQGRGRLEWTDDDGRVAGLQFTDVTEDFRQEIRTWLAAASPYLGQSSAERNPPKARPNNGTSQPASEQRRTSAESREKNRAANGADARSSAKPAPQAQPTSRVIPSSSPEQISGGASARTSGGTSIGTSGKTSLGTPAGTTASTFSGAAAAENPRVEHGLPWAASLPPAVGLERKPSRPQRESSTSTIDVSASSGSNEAHPLATADDEDDSLAIENAEQPGNASQQSASRAASGSSKAVAELETSTVESLNEHAQALLQHFQQEEARSLAAFRDSTTRLLREAERRLFPIREGVHAQISNLECSVTAATATAKALDQYPALLEKAQQQALDRFQAQLQEVLRIHVTELRRRSEAILEGVATLQPPANSRRISTSSGIVITAIIILALALLFTFRRETSDGLIWLGQQLVEPAPTPEIPATAAPAAKPRAEEQGPAPRSASTPSASTSAPAVASAPRTTAEAIPQQREVPTAPVTPKSVRALWDDVAKGDVSAQLTLGNMYLTGQGVTKNCFQARRLFAAAAKKGSAEGQQKLAQVDRSCS